jgi:hypothetical protein
MAFDTKRFGATEFAPRQQDVDVSKGPLAAFFGDDDEKVFVVQGLNATQLAVVNEATITNSTVEKVLKALDDKKNTEAEVKELRKAMGLSETDTPATMVKNLELVKQGLVKPELTMPQIVRVAEVSPIEFQILANTITRLTGQGAEAKVKRRASGRGKTSKPA